MARAVKRTRRPFGPATIKVAVVGLALCTAISAGGAYAQAQGLNSTWYLTTLKNQGLDFAYVGQITFAVMVFVHFLRPMHSRQRLDFVKSGPLWISTLVLLDAYLIELFQEMHGYGDWRDVVAETTGWLATLIPVAFAKRRDRSRSSASHTSPGRNSLASVGPNS